MTIGFHTLRHRLLTGLSERDVLAALVEGREALEAVTAEPIRLFAYPHGRADVRVAACVRSSGYLGAWTGRPRAIKRGNDPYRLGRWETWPVVRSRLRREGGGEPERLERGVSESSKFGDARGVSVIIPTHDRCERLRLALRSALAQRGVDVEVIVVDDGSSDGTRAFVEGLKDPRVRLVHNEVAMGESGARNRGISEAGRAWVAFLDDDDLWAPDKLASQLDALQDDGARVGLRRGGRGRRGPRGSLRIAATEPGAGGLGSGPIQRRSGQRVERGRRVGAPRPRRRVRSRAPSYTRLGHVAALEPGRSPGGR